MTATAHHTASRRHLSVGAERDLLVRLAGDADAMLLRRLAALDSSTALAGDVLVAEVDGTAVAAMSMTDGRVVADPFRHTAGVVDVLRVRAAALGADVSRAGASRRTRRLAPAQLRTA